MRIRLTIDDDVLAAARTLAAAKGKSVGKIISELACEGLDPARQTPMKWRNGVPLLPMSSDASEVSSALVHELQQELL